MHRLWPCIAAYPQIKEFQDTKFHQHYYSVGQIKWYHIIFLLARYECNTMHQEHSDCYYSVIGKVQLLQMDSDTAARRCIIARVSTKSWENKQVYHVDIEHSWSWLQDGIGRKVNADKLLITELY